MGRAGEGPWWQFSPLGEGVSLGFCLVGAEKSYTVASHALEQELPSCCCASSGRFNLRIWKARCFLP